MSRPSRRVFFRTGLAGTAVALTVSPVFTSVDHSFDQLNIIYRLKEKITDDTRLVNKPSDFIV